jgi:hypothetical protein
MTLRILMCSALDYYQNLPRKEVIHRQLPLPMPCYDFVPVTGPTVAPDLIQGLWVLPAPLT